MWGGEERNKNMAGQYKNKSEPDFFSPQDDAVRVYIRI